MAAAVLRALTEQSRTGGSTLATFSLARTARWLTHGLVGHDGPRTAGTETPGDALYEPADHLRETDSPAGRLRHALPPVSFAGAPATWTTPPGLCGTDAPVWREGP